MPARKHTPDFTACTQFGLRYSTLGKRIAASDPYREGENPREVTSTMNLYELCEALDIELTEEQAEKEAEYIYENRRQFYKNHPYMEKRAIAQCYDGPVFPEDVVYRRSNCEKYTVRKDGSIINTSGTVEIKTPNWEGFVHIPPKKHEKVATFTKGMPRKTNDKSPAITLPKQGNPLVKGEYKTRTPEEESRAKAKQRERARKEAAKTAAAESEDERILDTFIEHFKGFSPIKVFGDFGFRSNQILAYLERQKEQKPKVECDRAQPVEQAGTAEPDYGICGDFVPGKLAAALRRHGWYLGHVGENQQMVEARKEEVMRNWPADRYSLTQEQKPAEWSEDIIRKAVKEVGLTQHQIDWFKTNVFPPRQEWDEEDNFNLNWVIAILNGEPCDLDIQVESLISWLKSLPARFVLEVKREWSEEDEKKRSNLMSLLANMRGDRITEETYQKYYPWLKSLRPQPKQDCSACPENIKGYINGRNDALREMSDYINSRETPPQSSLKPSTYGNLNKL